jgi:hypothetical protein
LEIKLLPGNINSVEGFKLSKAWNPNISLLRHSHVYHENPKKTKGEEHDNRDTRLSNMAKG